VHKPVTQNQRVLVSAPYGRDAESIAQLLGKTGCDAAICSSLGDLAPRIDEHAWAIIVTEEALNGDIALLQRALEAQPAWSDIPFILLAGRRAGRDRLTQTIHHRLAESATNIILLERPLSTESLMSTIASAIRARQKQFQIRDQLTELDAQRTRLNTLLDNLPVGIAFLNANGSTLIANPAFRRFSANGAVPSSDAAAWARWIALDAAGSRLQPDQFPVARALRGEHVTGVEFRYTGFAHDEVWTRISGIPLLDDDKSVVGAIGVVVDIDDQKRAQEQLAKAAEALEAQVAARTADLERALNQLRLETAERTRAEAALRQSQKMEAVGQLTGGIAHDFNNMLTGIIGAIDIMKRRMASNQYDDLGRFMDAASASARRAASLTSRLLAFSRRQSLDSRPTDINALVLSLLDLLRRTMTERVSVAIETAADLPSGITDANQLESAILNLAINARDAMPDGGKLTIETRFVELDEAYCRTHPGVSPHGYVVIAVSDAGVGMAPAVLEKVFDPFFTTKPIGQGTGLGLSMVYGFAQQSNGQVRIHSTPGQGTSVKIFLPAGETRQTEQGQSLRAAPEGSGQTVLMVEDDPSVRLLVSDVLEELGYRAVEAADAQAAIKHLESGMTFDLMISDVGLPGMNGRQLAEIAREHRPNLPILFVTGYAENAAIRASFLGTNMAMVTKPFHIEELAAKISQMLTRSTMG
jgi:signal transduction histidine kinase/CheY-like chemotaxis protein